MNGLLTLLNRMACLSVLMLLSGCGGGSDLPKGETGTVNGKVTFQGQPIPKESIVLFVNSKSGIIGTGVVAEGGAYQLKMRDGLSILCGEYRVAITPPPPATAALSQDEIMKLQMENKLPAPVEIKEIPDRYRNVETSPLYFTVKPGSNDLPIDMKEKD